jgi:hypothetical protein
MPINMSWNTFWDVMTVVNDEGWFAEIRIPFSGLRFQETDGQIVMGIILWRWIPHQSEQLIFRAIPVKWGVWSAWKPSQAREMILQDVPSRRSLTITPYLLGGSGRSYELNEAETPPATGRCS